MKLRFFLIVISFTLFSKIATADIIHNERSLYRNIIIQDNDDLRCLKFNAKSSKSNQSCILKSEPDKLVFNYTKLLFSSLLLIDKPQNILIIGLGGGTMSNSLHKLYPEAKIDNVEIDPAVVKVARQYFGFIENDNVKSYTKDGRIFIKRAIINKQQYDWIILDAFNGDYIPEHLLTQEFLSEVKSLLTREGVLAANTFSVSRLYAHESATYHAVFGHFFNVSNHINNNRVILAQSQQKKASDDVISKRAKSLNDMLSPLGVNIFQLQKSMTFTKEHQDWPENTQVLTDQFSPANLLNIE